MVIAPDLRSHLLDDEQVLWTGAPASGLLFTREDWIKIPFSFVFAGISVVVFLSALAPPGPKEGPPDLFFLGVATLFLSIGLFLVGGRFVLDAWLRRRTHYAVTNRRVLIARSAPFGAFIAMDVEQLPEVRLLERADGRGTIRFGHAVSPWARRGGASVTWTPSLDPTPQFLSIEQAKSVFILIQRAAQNHLSPSGVAASEVPDAPTAPEH